VAARIEILPCIDGDGAADAVRRALDLPRERAQALGLSAVHVSTEGRYENGRGKIVDMRIEVEHARAGKLSLPPDAPLPSDGERVAFDPMRIAVTNETTTMAAHRLSDAGHRTLALNFANGVNPGGGFLVGARAQEETLCRSSALYATLEGDPMYEAHRARNDHASTDWAILSPDVPFFRADDGTPLERPWRLSILSCAAPVADRFAPSAADLLRRRIDRVLAIGHAYRYEAFVLGAWGCGAFGNDPARTARDFRDALAGTHGGAFREVVFAIADCSPERRFLGPFRDAFAAAVR
jgi:uncharacterized protein (TIGR02452 family)